MKQYKRSDRLAEQMLRDISVVVDTGLNERLPGMVTFTHVRLTNDLRYATVYYSVLGSEETREMVKEFFVRNNKHIRRLVGADLHVRRIPEFTFKFDPSIEEGIKIEKLLEEIKSDSKK